MYAHLTGTDDRNFLNTAMENGLLPTEEEDLANYSLDVDSSPDALFKVRRLPDLNRYVSRIASILARTAENQRALAGNMSKSYEEVTSHRDSTLPHVYDILASFKENWFQLFNYPPEEYRLDGLTDPPGGEFNCKIHVSFP